MKSVQLIFLIISCHFSFSAFAQNWLDGAEQKWDNNPKEWTIYTDSLEGELNFRWQLSNGTEAWDYIIGDDISGNIEQTWGNDRTEWTLRATNGEIITMKTVWQNDLTEWRITDNTESFKLQQKWNNDKNEWYIDDKEWGEMLLETNYHNDFRDWKVTDDLKDGLNIHFRMAIMFVVLTNTISGF